ncbi:MAG: tRNA pseudouridine(55) synthase TruB [Thermoguttaceae bacterium]
MDGILNLNKPAGVTSRDVVNAVQRLAGRQAKVGHAGTLDPLASGVLVAAVGPATRLIEYVQQLSKSYQAGFLLGCHSDSEDLESPVTQLDSPPVPTEEQILATFPAFTGAILQRPPAYSALKIEGRRAYRLARQGELLQLPPRQVVVHRLVLERYEYPKLELAIQCGSGTYVRSLGRDLALSLGTAAVMSCLVRTAVGPFSIDQAVLPDSLLPGALVAALLPSAIAVSHLPSLVLDDAATWQIKNGQTIERPVHVDPAADTVALDRSGCVIGILTGQDGGRLRVKRNFPTR